MQERRFLTTKEDLQQFGTWKTPSQLVTGDIIYGLALKSVPEETGTLQLYINSTHIPLIRIVRDATDDRYRLEVQSNYSYAYNDLRKDVDLRGQHEIGIKLYVRFSEGGYNYFSSSLNVGFGRQMKYGTSFSSMKKYDSNVSHVSTGFPEIFYYPIYIGTGLYTYYSTGNGTNNRTFESDLYISYNGGTNTLSGDDILFLVTPIES